MRCKCIIVDDEPPAIKVLENYINAVSQPTWKQEGVLA